MRLRIFLGLLVGIGAMACALVAVPDHAVSASPAIIVPDTTTMSPQTAPPVTFNEFLPEERGLGDCISAVPRPGCGSKARGGWRQTLVFLAIVGGLGVIGWRVVVGARRGRSGDAPRI